MGARRIDWFVWIGVDAVQAAAVSQGRWLEESRVTEGPLQSKQAAGFDAIEALGRMGTRLTALKGDAPARLWVVVADAHVRSATLSWTPLQMREALLPSLVQAQLVQAGHEPGARDRIRVGQGAAGQPRLLVAYPQALLTACDGLAALLGASLTSLLPLSALAWQQARRRGLRAPQLGVLTDGVALLLEAGHPGGRELVRVGAWRQADPELALRVQWRRWRMRAQAGIGSATDADPVTQPLALLDWRTQAPPSLPRADDELSWMPVAPALSEGVPTVLRQLHEASGSMPSCLDAVVRQAAPTPLRWAALLATTVLLVGLLVDNVSIWQDRRVAQEAVQFEPVRATEAPIDPAWSREELARIQLVNEAVRRLNVPVEGMLLALQPPPDIPVSLLSVDIHAAASGGRGVSQIRAQASVGQDMSRYVAFVGARAPFVDAHLKQHERRESEPGQPYQFAMEAAWPQ